MSAVTGSALGALNAFGQYGNDAAYMKAGRQNALREAKNNAFLAREAAARKGSAQKAVYGASGVDVNAGSALAQLARTEADGEVNALLALHEGEAEAAEWRLRGRKARQGLVTGNLNMGAGLLGPAFPDAASFWSGFSSGGGRK